MRACCWLVQPDITCNIPALFRRSLSQSLPNLHRVILPMKQHLPLFHGEAYNISVGTVLKFIHISPEWGVAILSQLFSHYRLDAAPLCHHSEHCWRSLNSPNIKPRVLWSLLTTRQIWLCITVLQTYWSSQFSSNSPITQPIIPQFTKKNAVGDGVQNIIKVKIYYVHNSPLVHRLICVIKEGNHLGQA